MPAKLLTDAAIRNLKPKEKPYKVAAGEGLYLLISPTGGKLWRMNYRHNGKQKTLAIGGYPAVSLKSAKELRNKANELRAAGIDPAEEKKTIRDTIRETIKAEENLAISTFQHVALDWHATYSKGLTPVHAAKLLSFLENRFFPSIGGLLVSEITPAHILEVSKAAESKGHINTAHKLNNLCTQVLEHARIKGLIQYNVAHGLNKALVADKAINHPAITDPIKIGRLLVSIENLEASPAVYYFMNILPHVFVRQSELWCAKWEEIDFEKYHWVIPSSRMKIKGRRDFVVPLSPQVVELFRKLEPFTHHSPDSYIFPSARGNSRPLSDSAGRVALRTLGYSAEEHTLHGFRSMASTLLNEMGYRADVIEACLAHGDPDKVRGVYNRAEYLEERTTLMAEWSNYLDKLKKDYSPPHIH